MSAKHDLANSKLTPDDLYARQNGWVEADGTLTSFGRGALLQYLYQENQSELVAATKAARQRMDEMVNANYAAEAAASPAATSRG